MSGTKRKSLRSKVLKYALEQYGTEPEFPWMKTPEAAVLRHTGNKKWYGLIMTISRKHLGLEGEDMVDVLNLKCDPVMSGSIRMQEGILPAYHMNKEQWISVLLDGTVDFNQITFLIDISFCLTSAKKGPKKAAIRNTIWLVPANPKYIDLEQAIDHSPDGTFLWKQSNSICPGDTVYLYVAAPVSAIKYECKALEVDIPFDNKFDALNIKKLMKLQLIRRFDQPELGLDMLKNHGVMAVRGPRSIPNSLLEKIKMMYK